MFIQPHSPEGSAPQNIPSSSPEYSPSSGDMSDQSSKESKPLNNPLSVLEIEKPKEGGGNAEDETTNSEDSTEGERSTTQTKSINIILN
jgi:hypothetical protein